MSSLPNLTDRRILVTGASGSIGSATACRLSEAGAHVVISGRNTEKLNKLATHIPANKVTIAPYDLSDTDGIPSWIKSLAEKDGPFAGIAHIAGTQNMRAIRMMDMAFIDRMFRTNTITGIMLGKGLRQRACHSDGAAMVFVGSISALRYGAGNSAYAASKGALVGATKAMAHELLRDKIRVNCVVPAMIESEMADKARHSVPENAWEAQMARHPMGMGTPDDVAHAIVYMLSDQAKWMTGTDLLMDGGFSLI